MSRDELKEFIVNNSILPENYEFQINSLKSLISKEKEKYYDNYIRSKDRDKHRKNIEDLEFSIIQISHKINRYYGLTCDGYAELKSALYRVEHSTFSFTNKPYDWSKKSLFQVYSFGESKKIEDEDIRELALDDEWRSIWDVRKEVPIFSVKAYELTQEQRSLIKWSNFYDSIIQCPDCPSEEMLKDKYAVDGWLISRKKEKEYEGKSGSSEIFIHATSPDDLSRINDLNSKQSRQVKEKLYETRG